MLIYQLFEQSGLTLSETARRIGISKSHLHSILNGKYENMSLSVAKAIADFYGVSLDDLVENDEMPNDMKLLHYLNNRSGAMVWQALTPQQRQILHTWLQDDYETVSNANGK